MPTCDPVEIRASCLVLRASSILSIALAASPSRRDSFSISPCMQWMQARQTSFHHVEMQATASGSELVHAQAVKGTARRPGAAFVPPPPPLHQSIDISHRISTGVRIPPLAILTPFYFVQNKVWDAHLKGMLLGLPVVKTRTTYCSTESRPLAQSDLNDEHDTSGLCLSHGDF